MNIDQLVSLVTLMLAISLAAERLVTTMKCMFPKWLAEEKKPGPVGEDILADAPRRVAVVIIAIIASYVTTAFVAKSPWPFTMITIGGERELPVIVVALLGSGGSAFWNNMLGYTKAVKEIRTQERDAQTIANTTQAASAGVPLTAAAAARVLPDHSPVVQASLRALRGPQAPPFGAQRR